MGLAKIKGSMCCYLGFSAIILTFLLVLLAVKYSCWYDGGPKGIFLIGKNLNKMPTG